ncbi:peptidase a4 family domain-containing protein [Acrodontium crateriforme]|uniref:Peptidase a4 family domain-containing protein n=1 Tax=Acrodontium crateriforme TaxID=150365 RepID=A0AAQ3M1L9_9PEZI|nr:peptidase a4 family domain-containing protein [Acrodontium crateriforme]
MQYSLLSVATLLGAAAAIPQGKTAAGAPHSQLNAASGPPKGDIDSSNWCGAVTSVPDVRTVEATWVVPTASSPAGSTTYWNYQWIGIDGVNDCGVLLQGGTGFTTNDPNSGDIEYYFWYEFYPADPVFPGDLVVQPGDTVYIKVTATSTTTGTIYTENISRGTSRSYDITSENGPLCLKYAEYITEDPGDRLPFAAFTDYDMTSCRATDGNGSSYDLSNPQMWYLDYYGQDKCDATIESGSDIRFNYH